MRRRRAAVRQLSVAVSLLVFAACASQVGAGKPAAKAPSSSTRPSTITVHGKTLQLYKRQGPVETVIVSSSDPRLLFVRYARRRADSKQSPICAPLVKPFVYIARQTPTTVTLGIGGYRAPLSGSGTVTCSAAIAGYERLPVHLAAPLGQRAVRSDVHNPVRVVSEASIPTPH